MPSCAAARSPFTSGTTSGTPSLSLKAEDLSTQMAPPRTAAGTSSLLSSVPTEKKQRSRSPAPSASGVASSIGSAPSPNGAAEPADRAEANARTWPKPRSASSARVTGPTAPVAPTTAMRGSAMGSGRLGAVELERGVQGLDGGLDLFARDEAGDLDRGGGDDVRQDADGLESRERLRGHSRMTPHARPDDAHLAEVLARRPLDAEAFEDSLGLGAIGRREHDLRPRLDDRIHVDACLGEGLEEPGRADAFHPVDGLLDRVRHA